MRATRLLVWALIFGATRSLSGQTGEVTCERGDLEVRRLTFNGNQTYRDADLEIRIATSQSSWLRRTLRIFGKRYCLDSLAVREDSLRLLVLYRSHGFYDATVGYRITRAGPRAVRVTFQVTEGRPVMVDSLVVLGLDSLPERDRVVRGLPLRTGARFDRFPAEATRDSIMRRLRERGYPQADVLLSYDADTVEHRAVVTYEALPGDRMHIGEIQVTVEALRDSADPKTRTHLAPKRIRSSIGIREGQLYRESSLEGVKRGLYLTEAFRHVAVNIDSASLDDPVDSLVTIGVTVIESDLHAARVSLGYGNLDCLRTQASFSHYAFLGRLRRLDVTGRLSKVGVGKPLDFSPGICTSQVQHDPLSDTLNYYASASLSQAALFGLPYIPTFTVYSERRSEFEAYLRETPIGLIASLQQAGDLRGFLKSYSYQLEYGSTVAQPAFFCAVFNVCEEAVRQRLERRERTAVLGVSATRNRSNSVVNPNRGSVLRLEARHASRLIGSSKDVEFNRGVVDWSFYRPALGGALAFRVRYGAVLGNKLSLSGSPRFIPLQERMYAGGPNSVRGYRQNELGPALYVTTRVDTIPIPGNDTLVYLRSDPDRSSQIVVPTGGDNVAIANLELRLRSIFLPDQVQYALFVDGGQVWTRSTGGNGINRRDFRVTPGVSLRYFSPIGPVRIDAGYNVYPRPAGPAYYNPLSEGGFAAGGNIGLICASPNNLLRVRLGDATGTNRTPPRQVDTGDCPATYAPAVKKNFFSRLNVTFSIGQPF